MVQNISKNKIKFLRSLQTKKSRDIENKFVIEGDKLVEEAYLYANDLIEEIYTTTPEKFSDKSHPIFLTSLQDLKQISSLKNPSTTLALLKQPNWKMDADSFTLALDNVQDPGNLGTIIRLADWFGLKNIICSVDTVDCFNPKVIQSSMGSIFKVKVTYLNLIDFLQKEQRPIYGALLDGNNVYQTSLPENAVLIMGNEGKGLKEETQKLINNKITIPRIGQAESLNVASATAILLSEFFRVRL
jgi:TrmH family RNA methyltransferase